MEFNLQPTHEGTQGAIIVAMRDLCKNAEDAVWLTPFETVFERLATLHKIAGGKPETLKEIFPEYFDLPERRNLS